MAKYDKEKNLPVTEFVGYENKRADGLNGPGEILNTLLEILKMFNPEATHSDNETKGGISSENIRDGSVSEKCLSKEFTDKILSMEKNISVLSDSLDASDKHISDDAKKIDLLEEKHIIEFNSIIDRLNKIPELYANADIELKAEIEKSYTALFNELKNTSMHTHANKTILDTITEETLNNTLQSVAVESEEEIAALVKTNYKVFHIKMKIDNTVSSGSGLGGSIVITPTTGETTTYKQFYIFNKAEKYTVGGLSGAGSSEYVQLKLSDTGIFKRMVTVNSDLNETVTFEDWKPIIENSEPFVVTLVSNDNLTVESVDKTFEEILEAYNNGKEIKLIYEYGEMVKQCFLTLIRPSVCVFSSVYTHFNQIDILCSYDANTGEDTWSIQPVVALNAYDAQYATRASSDWEGNVIYDTYQQKPAFMAHAGADIIEHCLDGCAVYCQNPLDVLQLELSDTFTNLDVAYYTITFTSGANSTTFSFINTYSRDVLFAGADCADGSFVPTANKIYNIIITKIGTEVWADVGERDYIAEV